MGRCRSADSWGILERVALKAVGKAGARIAFKSIGKKGVKWRLVKWRLINPTNKKATASGCDVVARGFNWSMIR